MFVLQDDVAQVSSNIVDTPAMEIRAKQLKFYTSVGGSIAQDLGDHINSGFSLLSMDWYQWRQWWDEQLHHKHHALVAIMYQLMKCRRQLAHHCLLIMGGIVEGVRPEEFDQDSMGGARRWSFYFAEDLLREYQDERQEDIQYESRTDPGMSQRRNVVLAVISDQLQF
ncbi:hypothetical protein BDZ97DRAFT_1921045 [Flammula alnicola]|nr:hypothetical protein BDZ97DRAFT_1921045 [Flammula alnicola]